MKNVVIHVGLLAAVVTLAAAGTTQAAQSAGKSDANAVKITGKVSCARFGRGSITPRKGMSVSQTIQYCVTFQHSEYTLVAGNQIFLLAGDQKVLAKMSGETVTIDGRLSKESPDVARYALMSTVEVTNVVPTKN